jgi:hypothetical protein
MILKEFLLTRLLQLVGLINSCSKNILAGFSRKIPEESIMSKNATAINMVRPLPKKWPSVRRIQTGVAG